MKRIDLLKEIDKKEKKAKSQRQKAICLYAYEMVEYLEDIENFEEKGLKKLLLNGAENFIEYSMGGCSLVYDGDIEERLPKTYKTKEKKNNPTYWLEQQAHYLYEGYNLIFKIIVKNE